MLSLSSFINTYFGWMSWMMIVALAMVTTCIIRHGWRHLERRTNRVLYAIGVVIMTGSPALMMVLLWNFSTVAAYNPTVPALVLVVVVIGAPVLLCLFGLMLVYGESRYFQYEEVLFDGEDDRTAFDRLVDHQRVVDKLGARELDAIMLQLDEESGRLNATDDIARGDTQEIPPVTRV